MTIGTAGVTGQQDLVPLGIHDGDNDSGRDLGIFNLAALRADAGPLCGAVNCGMSAAAAEFPVQTETIDLGGSDSSKCQIFRLKITEHTGSVEVFFREHESTGILRRLAEECSVINGKEIFTVQKKTFHRLTDSQESMDFFKSRKIYLRMLRDAGTGGSIRYITVFCMGGQIDLFSVK